MIPHQTEIDLSRYIFDLLFCSTFFCPWRGLFWGKMEMELDLSGFLEEQGWDSIDDIVREIEKLTQESLKTDIKTKRLTVLKTRISELQKYLEIAPKSENINLSTAYDDQNLEPEGLTLQEVSSEDNDIDEGDSKNPPFAHSGSSPNQLHHTSPLVDYLKPSDPRSKPRRTNHALQMKASPPTPFDKLFTFSLQANDSTFQVKFFVYPPNNAYRLRKVTCTLDEGWTSLSRTIQMKSIANHFVYVSNWNRIGSHLLSVKYTFKYHSTNYTVEVDGGTVDLCKYHSQVIHICSYFQSKNSYDVPLMTQMLAFFSLLKAITSLHTWAAAFSHFRLSFIPYQKVIQLTSSSFLPHLQTFYRSGGDRINEVVFGMLSLIDPLQETVNNDPILYDITSELLLSLGNGKRAVEVIGTSNCSNFIRTGIYNCLICNSQSGDFSWLLFPRSSSELDLETAFRISISIPPSSDRQHRYSRLLPAIDLLQDPEELSRVLEVAPFPEQREAMIQSWKSALCQKTFLKKGKVLRNLLSGLTFQNMICFGRIAPGLNVPSLRNIYFNMFIDGLLLHLQCLLHQNPTSHPIIFPIVVINDLMEALLTLGTTSDQEAWEIFLKFLSHPQCKWLALRVFYHENSLNFFQISDSRISQARIDWFHACARNDFILCFACAFEILTIVKSSRSRNLELNIAIFFCQQDLNKLCKELPVLSNLKSIQEYSSLSNLFQDAHLTTLINSFYYDQWKINLREYLKIVDNWGNHLLNSLGFCDGKVSIEIRDPCLHIIFTEFKTLLSKSNDGIVIEITKEHFSEFFVDFLTLLRSTDPLNSLLDDPFLRSILDQLHLFFETFRDETILFGTIEKLKVISGFSNSLFLLSQIVQIPFDANFFEGVADTLKSYINILEVLESFITTIFSGHISESDRTWKTSDFDECHEQAIKLLRIVSQTPLSSGNIVVSNQYQVRTLAIWGNTLGSILPVASTYSPLLKSSIFKNSFSIEINSWMNQSNSITSSDICRSVIPATLRRVEILFSRFSHSEDLYLKEIVSILLGVTLNTLDLEVDLIFPFIVSESPLPLIREDLACVLSISHVSELCGAVIKLGEFFEAPDYLKYSFAKVMDACDLNYLEVTTLETLKNKILYFDSILKEFRGADDIFLELSRAEPLLEFSKEVAGETNLNLHDSVEHFGESAVGIGVVSDFDMVRHLLKEPLRLLLEGTNRMDLISLLRHFSLMKIALDHPHTITDSNSVLLLASRIKECNKHAHGLRSLYNQVSQRQELMKSIIINLLESGTIHLFIQHGSCQMEAFFFEEGNKKIYSSKRLLDFKGRALLHINSNLIEYQGETSGNQLKGKLELFSQLISIAIESLNLLDSLLCLGHIKYPRFDQQFRLTTENLEGLLEKLKSDQSNWETALKQLRDTSYHFNDFFGYQIVALVHFLTNSCSDHEIDIVTNLLLSATSGSSMETQERHELILRYRGCCENLPDMPLDINQDHDVWLLQNIVKNLMDLRSEISSEVEEDFKLEALKHDGIAVVPYDNDKDLFPILFTIYSGSRRPLRRRRLLICDSTTNKEEMNAFAKRVFSPKFPTHGIYSVINFANMSHVSRSALITALLSAAGKRNENSKAIVLIPTGKYLDELNLPIARFEPRPIVSLQQLFHHRNVFVRTGRAGSGKTESIRKHANANFQKRIHTISIGDTVTRLSLAHELSQASLLDDECFHFDISDMRDKAGIDLALFELLVLGSLQVGHSIVNFTKDSICYVEVASSYDDLLRSSLPILNYFHAEEIIWSIDDLVVDEEKSSDIQVVANYLRQLRSGQIAQHFLTLNPRNNFEVIPRDEVISLLQIYFFDHFGDSPPSLNVLNIFLGVLGDQFRKFSRSSFLRTMKQNGLHEFTEARQSIISSFVEHCRDFAGLSSAAARTRQNSSLDENRVDLLTAGLIRWEETLRVMVVMHSRGSFAALYRSVNHIDPKLRTLLESQQEKPLPDYFNMNSAELLRELSKFSCLPPLSDTDVARNYVLTPDNFLKIVMIYIRLDAGLPIIIMGETGQYILRNCSAF
jgi:hypothetical protein